MEKSQEHRGKKGETKFWNCYLHIEKGYDIKRKYKKFHDRMQKVDLVLLQLTVILEISRSRPSSWLESSPGAVKSDFLSCNERGMAIGLPAKNSF
jgi:hypothetical protein